MMTENNHKLYKFKRKIIDIIDVGGEVTWMSRCYEVFSALAILINLTATFMSTDAHMRAAYGNVVAGVFCQYFVYSGNVARLYFAYAFAAGKFVCKIIPLIF